MDYQLKLRVYTTIGYYVLVAAAFTWYFISKRKERKQEEKYQEYLKSLSWGIAFVEDYAIENFLILNENFYLVKPESEAAIRSLYFTLGSKAITKAFLIGKLQSYETTHGPFKNKFYIVSKRVIAQNRVEWSFYELSLSALSDEPAHVIEITES